jgi:hypothetical protein
MRFGDTDFLLKLKGIYGMFPYKYQHGLTLFQPEKTAPPLAGNQRQARYTHQWGVGLGFIVEGVMAAAIMSLTTTPVAHADDASELVTQALLELSQANTDLAQAINVAEASPGGTAAAYELSSLGAQNYFQEQLGAFLNSLPTIPAADETSNQLILTLQYLDGNLGEATMVNNDANLADFAVLYGGQELSIIGDNATAFLNDGSITGAETAVQLAFDSLGL